MQIIKHINTLFNQLFREAVDKVRCQTTPIDDADKTWRSAEFNRQTLWQFVALIKNNSNFILIFKFWGFSKRVGLCQILFGNVSFIGDIFDIPQMRFAPYFSQRFVVWFNKGSCIQ